MTASVRRRDHMRSTLALLLVLTSWVLLMLVPSTLKAQASAHPRETPLVLQSGAPTPAPAFTNLVRVETAAPILRRTADSSGFILVLPAAYDQALRAALPGRTLRLAQDRDFVGGYASVFGDGEDPPGFVALVNSAAIRDLDRDRQPEVLLVAFDSDSSALLVALLPATPKGGVRAEVLDRITIGHGAQAVEGEGATMPRVQLERLLQAEYPPGARPSVAYQAAECAGPGWVFRRLIVRGPLVRAKSRCTGGE